MNKESVGDVLVVVLIGLFALSIWATVKFPIVASIVNYILFVLVVFWVLGGVWLLISWGWVRISPLWNGFVLIVWLGGTIFICAKNFQKMWDTAVHEAHSFPAGVNVLILLVDLFALCWTISALLEYLTDEKPYLF